MPLKFKMSLFDFTANDFSRTFEPYMQSNGAFARRFQDYISGKPRNSLTSKDLEISPNKSVSPVNQPESRCDSPQHLLHAKRPATTIPLPEVESPPACVKKIKHNDRPTQIKNTEFKTAVVEKYSLREGMNIIVVLIDIVENHREYVNIYQYRGCLGCFTS